MLDSSSSSNNFNCSFNRMQISPLDVTLSISFHCTSISCFCAPTVTFSHTELWTWFCPSWILSPEIWEPFWALWILRDFPHDFLGRYKLWPFSILALGKLARMFSIYFDSHLGFDVSQSSHSKKCYEPRPDYFFCALLLLLRQMTVRYFSQRLALAEIWELTSGSRMDFSPVAHFEQM